MTDVAANTSRSSKAVQTKPLPEMTLLELTEELRSAMIQMDIVHPTLNRVVMGPMPAPYEMVKLVGDAETAYKRVTSVLRAINLLQGYTEEPHSIK